MHQRIGFIQTPTQWLAVLVFEKHERHRGLGQAKREQRCQQSFHLAALRIRRLSSERVSGCAWPSARLNTALASFRLAKP